MQLEALEDRRLLSFNPAVAYPVGIDPRAVVAGDFNGDGSSDAAVTGSHGPVRILLGNGDGTLRAAGDYLEGAYGLDIAAGDLNADGALDLAVVAYADTSVRILLGDGNGAFQSGPTARLDGGIPGSIAIGDFSADGVLDLVLGGYHTFSGCDDEYGDCWSATFGEINVLLGQGDGSFSAAAGTLVNHLPGDLVVTDVNGDRNLDVAFTGGSANYGSALQIMLGTGGGGLSFGATYPLSYPDSLAAADFNADGKTDLVVGNRSLYLVDPDTLSLFLGAGDGAFQTPRTIASGGKGGGDAAVSLGDFNHDGRTDIAVAKEYGNRVNVLLGHADGAFRSPEEYLVVSPVGLVSTDLDGDGFDDLVTINGGYNGPNVASVLLNDGVWQTAPPVDVPSISIGDVTKKEGNGKKTTLFTFTVTLSAAFDQAVTVSFATAEGTAKAGEDYIAKTGTLTFAPGETTKTITIEVKSETKKEANETFYLDLFGNSSNSLFTKKRGIGTILNDDN